MDSEGMAFVQAQRAAPEKKMKDHTEDVRPRYCIAKELKKKRWQ